MTDVRDHLALAIDVADLDAAEQLAKEVSQFFGVAKIGLELFTAAGPEAISRLRALDLKVFADLKYHDIPNTVGRAARVLGHYGVTYANFHAAGGHEMMRAAVAGLAEGARDAGHESPVPIAVTVLTSDPDTSAFDSRLRAAIESGCGGVVCSAHEVERVHAAGPELITIVPGVRFADGPVHDQARVATPDAAARAGADMLVIGRAVTDASDPRRAAQRVFESVLDTYSQP